MIRFQQPKVSPIHWRIGLLSCFLLFTSAALARPSDAPIKVAASVDLTTIHVGDLLQLTIDVTYPKELVVRLPEDGADLGPFEIRSHRIVPPVEVSADQFSARSMYTLSAFETGKLELPALGISYWGADDQTKGVVYTDPIEISVETLLAKGDNDIRDIKPPLSIRRDWLPVIVWLALGALLAAGAFYLWYRGRKVSPRGTLSTVSLRLPHEIALEELERLRRSELLNRGEIKQYHIEVSEIVRRYLEQRYSIEALEMTSAEIMDAVAQAALCKSVNGLLSAFLSQCDLVKFARLQPIRTRCERALDQAVEIVQKTIPGEPVLKGIESAIAPAQEGTSSGSEVASLKRMGVD